MFCEWQHGKKNFLFSFLCCKLRLRRCVGRRVSLFASNFGFRFRFFFEFFGCFWFFALFARMEEQPRKNCSHTETKPQEKKNLTETKDETHKENLKLRQIWILAFSLFLFLDSSFPKQWIGGMDSKHQTRE